MLNKAYRYIKTYKDLGEVIPTVVGLSVFLSVTKSTLYEWIKDEKNPEFSNALEMVSNNQELKLINGGLNNAFNSTITKLMLSNNHNITDTPKESEEKAPPLTINFSVSEPVNEITVTNADS